jgi:hypothetical protein
MQQVPVRTEYCMSNSDFVVLMTPLYNISVKHRNKSSVVPSRKSRTVHFEISLGKYCSQDDWTPEAHDLYTTA